MTGGWGPRIAAGPDGRWVTADEFTVHLWSGDALQRSVDLPVPAGGPPRFLADGSLRAGRCAVDLGTGAAKEVLPVEPLLVAYDRRADADQFVVREVAWDGAATHALVLAEYVPTRLHGASDVVEPGWLLAFTAPDGDAPRVLLRDMLLAAGPLAADRWLVSGGRSVTVFDPGTGAEKRSHECDDTVGAVATVADTVAAGLAGGDVLVLDVAGDAAPLRWQRHEGVVEAVAVSPDGSLVASGDRRGDLAVWRSDGSAEVLRTHVSGTVDGLCFLADDHVVAAVGGAERALQHLRVDG